MDWLKYAALAGCLVSAFTVAPWSASAATADATAVKSEALKADTSKAAAPTTADEDKDDTTKMSETDKRAKAIECSKQADTKKLHGEARKKFRSACKRGK